MKNLWRSLRNKIDLLFIVIGGTEILLMIYLIANKRDPEFLLITLVGLSFGLLAVYGFYSFIQRRVNTLSKLVNNLSISDRSARQSTVNHKSFLNEIDQSINQIASSIEEIDNELIQRNNEFAALVDMMNELALQHDSSQLLKVIAEKVKVLLHVSNVTILLYDSDHDAMVVNHVEGTQVPIGLKISLKDKNNGSDSLIRQPFIVNNYQTWDSRIQEIEPLPISALLHVPMIHQGELIGLLAVAEIEPDTRRFSETDVRLLSLFAGQAANAIKIEMLFTETHRHLQELEAINEVSKAARSANGILDMLKILLNKTMELTDACRGGIWLYDSAKNMIVRKVSKKVPDLDMLLKPSEGIIGTVFFTGQPYFTVDLKKDRLTSESVRSKIPDGLSAVFIPIRSSQIVEGILVLGFQSPKTLSEQQIQLATTISENAGNAIHRTQLHEKMKQQLQQLNALHEIDSVITSSLDLNKTLQVLLDQVINQLGVDAACVLVFNPSDQTLEFAASRGFVTEALHNTRLKLGEGYAGQAAVNQKIVHISDLKKNQADFSRSPLFQSEDFLVYYAVPLVTRNQIKGVLEVFHRSTLEGDAEWLDFLGTVASQAAIAIDIAKLFMELQRSNAELTIAYDSTLEGWSHALDLRDHETQGHSQRVTELSIRLAKAMSVEESDLVQIHRGALLHDIGKIGIPDEILLKNGSLDEEEMGKIREHPEIAFDLLAPIPYLRPALDIPYCHHERWDGSGYPRGLKGEEIPLAARIFMIVDVWDALTSDRPYRKAWTMEEAMKYLREEAGKQFDPVIINAFLSMLNKEKNGE